MSSVVEMILGKDIVLDQEAFQKAAQDMSQLAGKLQQLREDIQQMLAKIKEGFNTPAGTKFIQSCESHLLQPLDDQKIVIDHVAENLNLCKTEYQSVFDGYRDLNTTIKNLAN